MPTLSGARASSGKKKKQKKKKNAYTDATNACVSPLLIHSETRGCEERYDNHYNDSDMRVSIAVSSSVVIPVPVAVGDITDVNQVGDILLKKQRAQNFWQVMAQFVCASQRLTQ